MKKAIGLVALVALTFAALAAGQDSRGSANALGIVGARVYTSPGEPPIENGTVIVSNGRMTAVGDRAAVTVPLGAATIAGEGLTVTAGFWNSHVHFSDKQWDNASTLPAAQLARQLEAMLTRYGFTSVFDTGSLLQNTIALRRRITANEIAGPRILTSGEPFAARNGTPYYVRPIQLPELLDPTQASAAARAHLSAGADAIKLHAGAIVDRDRDLWVAIDVGLVQAVVAEAHASGKFVLAHPQYLDGLRHAVDGGVDVLLHVTELLDQWPKELLARAIAQRIAMVPTLKLLASPEFPKRRQNLLRQVREFREAGGEILFGTDVGFIPDYDPAEEYVSMQLAGMSGHDILRSLTIAPARRFAAAEQTGRIAVGADADLVVLEGDPIADVRNFVRVRHTIRAGRVIYSNGRGPLQR